MLIAVSSVRQRYYAYLDERKKDEEREEKSKKRKSVLKEIQEIGAKKKRFEKDITSLESSAVEFEDKAEKQGKLTLIANQDISWHTIGGCFIFVNHLDFKGTEWNFSKQWRSIRNWIIGGSCMKHNIFYYLLQLKRVPREFPKLVIKREVTDIDDFKFEDFEIVGYNPHPKIAMEMAV
ncbi:TYMS [Mytilus edulis]|uniref:Thymidylate synthase n=1 Tax=Mytilus edulis TaxID=6550 RepID=A0A8S3UDQ0_MYTED|nr:TYMS [Mytilus edulis]